MGTAAHDRGNSITSDTNGNVYVSGWTDGGLDGNNSEGSGDFFVVKYDSSGVKQWTRQMGTADLDSAQGITSDNSGNVYVTGPTHGNLDGSSQVGAGDIFVVKYDGSGVKQWSMQFGSTAYERAQVISIDTNEKIYVMGYTEGDLGGNGNAGSEDIFIMKLK